MRVATDRFGEIDVADDRVLAFPDALPGFPEATRFALVEAEEGEVFYWLQSLDDPALAFLAAVPWPFFPDYEPELPDDDQHALGLESSDDAMVLCLLTVHREEQSVTANLLGPVVVNKDSRVGRQVVLVDGDHPLRAALGA